MFNSPTTEKSAILLLILISLSPKGCFEYAYHIELYHLYFSALVSPVRSLLGN